jgi:hypothetical protein
MLFKLTKWRGDEGGVDFIQLVVGLLIISIAAVGTLQALYYGYEQLDYQMRYRKAIAMARSQVEYIQARLHSDLIESDFRDQYFLAGNMANPEKRLLDERAPESQPNGAYDDIYCKVKHRVIVKWDDPVTRGFDYWKIQVFVEWNEPDEGDHPNAFHQVFFDARMIPAGI